MAEKARKSKQKEDNKKRKLKAVGASTAVVGERS